MWGTTSGYPTATTAFIIASCCLATDKGSEFWGKKIKGVGKKFNNNKKSGCFYSSQSVNTQFTTQNVSIFSKTMIIKRTFLL